MSLSKEEECILESIIVASENNPKMPEFPTEKPQFPATPTYKIDIDGFENVFLKDESYNFTGTHKDRMAWEIIVTYRDLLLAKKRGQNLLPLPAMSIISSGSAAIAIQTQLKKYNLPHLRVLVDINIDRGIIDVMESIGCEVYEIDLSRKCLHWKEILHLTHNSDGFDITSGYGLDPTTRFYDWLSYEILNNNPDYCFIPFGIGNLFENIVNINKKEVSTEIHDPRFEGNIKVLRGCHFLGSTTNNPKSKATKLYSPHLPFAHFDDQWIRLYQCAGFCGGQSNVYPLKEHFLDKAIRYASLENIQCEPSGIAGLALFFQMKDKILRDKKILIVSTGKTKYEKYSAL